MQQNNNIQRLATAPVGRLLWEYSLPAVTGMVVVSLYNVIDRVFIGHQVGADAIAGLAITFPVMNLATAFGVLIGGGSAARVSILLGAGDREGANRVLGNALVLTLLIGTLYVALFGYFLDDILIAFGATQRTLPPAHDFMSVLLPGLLLTNLTYSFNNIQRASGYPRRAMTAMILSAAINFVLAYIFIFVLKLGIRGAALATSLAMACALVFVMWHFVQPSSSVRFSRGTYRLSWRVVKPILAIGTAPSLINVAGCLVNVLINTRLVKYGGDSAVGAAGIFTTYTQFVVMVVLGICQGMQPIVGYNYGAGLLHRLRRTYWLATAASTVLCVAASCTALSLPGVIAHVFTTDATLIRVTEECLTLALIGFSVVGFQIVSTTLFQSIGAAGKATMLGLARQVIFLIPLLILLPRTLQLEGVWLSFPISDMLATLVTAGFIVHQLKRFK